VLLAIVDFRCRESYVSHPIWTIIRLARGGVKVFEAANDSF
jgi:hypothetical protein